MTDRTVFTPEAEEQLVELYRYISATGSPAAAAGYTNSIVAFCEELATFPRLGKARDDIRPGLRTIGFQRRVLVAFAAIGQDLVPNLQQKRSRGLSRQLQAAVAAIGRPIP